MKAPIPETEPPGGLPLSSPATPAPAEDGPRPSGAQLARELQRENDSWLAGQNEAFRSILSGGSVEDSLRVLIRTAVDQLGEGARCGIYLADGSGRQLRHVVGMPAGYRDEVDGFEIAADSVACGLAAFTGKPVITADVEAEPRWESWRWLAKKYDYRGSWSFPVETATGRVIGTFAIYFAAPRHATPRDHALAKILTGAAAIVLLRSQDAAERARAAQALRESEADFRRSEERLRNLADAVPQLIWSNREDGAADYFNRRWYDYSGLSFEQSYGLGWEAIVHPDDATAAREEWTSALAAGEIFECEFRLRGADGDYRWFIGRSVPMKDAAGQVQGFFGSATDIDDLKLAQAELQEADRRKNHFLATLGHELRNPLAAIRNGVALLRSEKARPESRAAALPVVADQVRHMERLVDDLLDLTRVVQGSIQVRREPMALQDALRQALEMVRPRAEADGFEIAVTAPDEPLLLLGDRVRLTQVLMNVLDNAMKYSGRSRRIEISVAGEEGAAVVRVRDHGLGISRALLPRIFEPFVQAKPGLTLEAGLGLGLAVVRQLVRLHGGDAEALSEGAGKGSEFILRLPLCPPADSPPA